MIYPREKEFLDKLHYINVVGLPIDFTSYQTLNNNRALAVVVMVRNIGVGDFQE